MQLARRDAAQQRCKSMPLLASPSNASVGSLPGSASSSGGAAGTTAFKTCGETFAPIRSASDIAAVATTVEATRVASAHNLNDRSSRSHCIITLRLKRGTEGAAGGVLTQTATFVDLAGSERVGKSGATGAALAQATSINQSMTTLGKVVHALASNKPHVPYRESKLTKLLKGQLEGRAKIALRRGRGRTRRGERL